MFGKGVLGKTNTQSIIAPLLFLNEYIKIRVYQKVQLLRGTYTSAVPFCWRRVKRHP